MDLTRWTASTRREFLTQAGAITTAIALASAMPQSGKAQTAANTASSIPWYKRTYRWSQTNITETDVTRYDIPWWRQHWKRTEVQGVIINGGGIVAYYPSKFPLQYRPAALGDRDLYGEVAKAAQEDGIVVLARMDSNRAHEPLFRAHPDWFAKNAAGEPIRAADLYVSCINSPYYSEYLPEVLREIIQRSKPQGVTDNSWSGLERNQICYCENCAKKFKEFSKGAEIPRQANWDDPAYRQWIEWNYQVRIQLWDFNNKVTREAGGADCLWLGMNSVSIAGQARQFRPFKEICERSEIVMLDHQSRPDAEGIQHNAMSGKLVHGLLGWDKLAPESMPMYQNGRPATFRLSQKPTNEAKMWMLSGFAGGIQPWYHHIGAYAEDRRAYSTAEPIMKWHKANEQYLVNRKPIATVGVCWSQRNTDYFGRDNAEDVVEVPWRGFTQALVRARIPYLPVHLDHIERDSADLSVLIFPNIGAISDAQLASIRKFVERGGSIIATGETSLYSEFGDARPDFALADLFGVTGGKSRREPGARAAATQHSYLRLTPELRGGVYGPKAGNEPAISGKRHAVLAGLDETDILEFGGTLQPLAVDPKAQVLMTFIPAFPTYPPETAYMRQPKTDIPGLILNETGKGRVVFLPAEIDRRFAIDNFPDHGNLLANLVRWAAREVLPLEVRGAGLIDCELYSQPGRAILHIVNLTNSATWRAPVDELVSVGAFEIKVRAGSLQPKVLKTLVAGKTSPIAVKDGVVAFTIPTILDHEVVVLEG